MFKYFSNKKEIVGGSYRSRVLQIFIKKKMEIVFLHEEFRSDCSLSLGKKLPTLVSSVSKSKLHIKCNKFFNYYEFQQTISNTSFFPRRKISGSCIIV